MTCILYLLQKITITLQKLVYFLHPTYRAIRDLSNSQKIFNNISYQRCSFFVYFAQKFVVKKINNDLGRSTRCYVWTFYSFCSKIVGKKAAQKWQKSKLRKCISKWNFFNKWASPLGAHLETRFKPILFPGGQAQLGPNWTCWLGLVVTCYRHPSI